MKKDITDDKVLRDWLEGNLSAEELEKLKTDSTFNDYKKIIEATDYLQLPNYNENELFSKVFINKSEPEPKKRINYWKYAVAATILLTLGLFFGTSLKTTHTTGFGEQLAVVLPDNSKVQLNANSTLKYKRFNWISDREISLAGEAFFEVEKGDAFVVKTPGGSVEVLGTKFNVISRNQLFETLCYEGKVKATSKGGASNILTKGMGFRSNNGTHEDWTFNETNSLWINGETSFYNTTLNHVITALTNQYKIKVKNKAINLDQRFTGSFTNKNLNLALKTVFDAMEISYTFEDDQTIVLHKTL